ncbi:ORFL162W, partial [Human betaherpesvirus 5]
IEDGQTFVEDFVSRVVELCLGAGAGHVVVV